GFVPLKRTVSLERGRRDVVTAALERDESSPFWKKPPREPRFLVETSVAALIVPTFGPDLASSCIKPCEQSLGIGGLVSLHAGYELGFGLGFGLTGGYFSASQTLEGRATQVKPIGLPEDIVSAGDRLSLRG